MSRATLTNDDRISVSRGTGGGVNLVASLDPTDPRTTQSVFTARLFADTQPRVRLDITDGLILGAGGSTAPDIRFYRTGTATVTLDNASAAEQFYGQQNGECHEWRSHAQSSWSQRLV